MQSSAKDSTPNVPSTTNCQQSERSMSFQLEPQSNPTSLQRKRAHIRESLRVPAEGGSPTDNPHEVGASPDDSVLGKGDPSREIAKLGRQIKAKESCIQALQQLFSTLLDKMTDALANPQVATIAIEESILEESQQKSMANIAVQFGKATGLNPEPLFTSVDLLNDKLLTLLRRPPPKPQVDCSSHLRTISDLEQRVQSASERIISLEVLLRESELMRKALEEDVSRMRSCKQQCQELLVESEREKEKLITYQNYKLNLIRQNYNRNGQVSPEVLALLDKIYTLEKKLREREFQAEHDRQQQLDNTQKLLEFVEKIKKERRSQPGSAPSSVISASASHQNGAISGISLQVHSLKDHVRPI